MAKALFNNTSGMGFDENPKGSPVRLLGVVLMQVTPTW
jgi:hypothetical protein